jgi:3-phosphoglycerate kinase
MRVSFCSGGMVFTFYKARGLGVGSSLVEEDQLELAKKLEKVAKVRERVTDVLQTCYICHKATTGWMHAVLHW